MDTISRRSKIVEVILKKKQALADLKTGMSKDHAVKKCGTGTLGRLDEIAAALGAESEVSAAKEIVPS